MVDVASTTRVEDPGEEGACFICALGPADEGCPRQRLLVGEICNCKSLAVHPKCLGRLVDHELANGVPHLRDMRCTLCRERYNLPKSITMSRCIRCRSSGHPFVVLIMPIGTFVIWMGIYGVLSLHDMVSNHG